MVADGGEATSTEADLFKQNWSAMDTYMRSKGFYNFAQEGPQVTEAGAVKKACVECGRSRPEVIYDVDRDLMKSWLSAYENPRDQGAAAASLGDRKVCIDKLPRVTSSVLLLQTLPALIARPSEYWYWPELDV